MTSEADFIRIIYKVDQYKPEVWHRALERVKVGTWFFGVLPIYVYQYTEWVKE